MHELENNADQIEDMFLLGEDLQEKLTSSGSLNVSQRMENIECLKKSLTDDVNQQLEQLDASLRRWNKFTTTQDEFEQWLANVEQRLNDLSSGSVQLNTPDELKVCDKGLK